MTLESDLVRRIVGLERRLAEIEARERAGSVVAIYRTGAGQSIPNGIFTIINYDTKEIDTHLAVTTGSSWKFTAPVSGYYHVDAEILFAATNTWADGEAGNLSIIVNGNTNIERALHRKDNYGSSASIMMFLGGSTALYLSAGDYIDVRVIQYSGGALSLYNYGTHNRIAIIKI
jgi:hypothetical protein